MSDGAGAVLLMKRSVAVSKGLPILGVFRCGICLSLYIEITFVNEFSEWYLRNTYICCFTDFIGVSSNHHFRSFAAVGVDPAVMGVGPAVAIPAAVKSAGLEIDDIDLFELNEVCSVVPTPAFLLSM